MSEITIKSPDYATKEFALSHGWHEMVPKGMSTVDQEPNPVGFQEFAQQFLQDFHDATVVGKKEQAAAKEAGDQAKDDAKDELDAAKNEVAEGAEAVMK